MLHVVLEFREWIKIRMTGIDKILAITLFISPKPSPRQTYNYKCMQYFSKRPVRKYFPLLGWTIARISQSVDDSRTLAIETYA